MSDVIVTSTYENSTLLPCFDAQEYKSVPGLKALAHSMAKLLSIIDAMLHSPKAEWVVWMSEDAWINPSTCVTDTCSVTLRGVLFALILIA